MRRKDREISDLNAIEVILLQCRTCHVAMVDEGAPYVTPLSYGYTIQAGNLLELYFHSAAEGRKLDILRRNNQVCFEMSYEGEPINVANPCNSGYYFASVIGFGAVEFLEDPAEKCQALSLIFKHQTGQDLTFTPEQAHSVRVFKIASKDFTGKKKAKPSS